MLMISKEEIDYNVITVPDLRVVNYLKKVNSKTKKHKQYQVLI